LLSEDWSDRKGGFGGIVKRKPQCAGTDTRRYVRFMRPIPAQIPNSSPEIVIGELDGKRCERVSTVPV
jgi:hypothetical protein